MSHLKENLRQTSFFVIDEKVGNLIKKYDIYRSTWSNKRLEINTFNLVWLAILNFLLLAVRWEHNELL